MMPSYRDGYTVANPTYMIDTPFNGGRGMSICDDCERADYWECRFCCAKCYEDYGECPNPDCDPMDI